MRLNLPEFEFRIIDKDGKKLIFDSSRKKFVVLTPEEWVRQNFVRFLTEMKSYPQQLITVEGSIRYNGLNRRFDVVVFDKSPAPIMIIECKAPEIKITDKVFEQIAGYNIKLQVEYLIVTNGLEHYCCKLDLKEKKYSFLSEIPDYFSIIPSGSM